MAQYVNPRPPVAVASLVAVHVLAFVVYYGREAEAPAKRRGERGKR